MEVYARHYARLKYTTVNKSIKNLCLHHMFNGKKSAMERHKAKNGRESIGSIIINIVVRKKKNLSESWHLSIEVRKGRNIKSSGFLEEGVYPDSSNSQCKARDMDRVVCPEQSEPRQELLVMGPEKAIRHQIIVVLPYIDGKGKKMWKEIGYHSN